MTRSIILFTALALLACTERIRVGPVSVPAKASVQTPPSMSSFFDLSATDIHGKEQAMAQYKGHKLLVVNTASECGFTPQYKQLQELYDTYKDKGFVIIGFPSNDFGGQEPGSEQQIEQFCQKNYGVTFPMMAKVSTKGTDKHAVYQWLTEKAHNGKMDSEVKWNFQKYLIDEQGHLVTMVASATEPLSPVITNWIDGKE